MKEILAKAALSSLAASMLLAGCGHGGTNNAAGTGANGDSPGKLHVAASFYPMYEFARQVAGDLADVTLMVPGGVEPHDWEPTPKDMALLSKADVFVYNGIVEGWAEQAISSAGNGDRVDVEASSGLELETGGGEQASDTREQAGMDPHVWLSPVLAQREVERIRDGLSKADSAHAADYEANAKAYIAKLQQLDADYRTALGQAKNKTFVTQHAAFGYLAREYGLTQLPISGLSPDQEPTPAQMASVVKEIKSLGISTIFFEELVDPKVAETIASETGAKTDVLNPIEGLTKDDKKQGLDYIGLMNQNLAALEKALNA
ncbi:zinc transport system substrate-binding protein [Cohnella sp. OV330]|uniref:metal ABC transporter substrate-binding protein n=1 Tax=Cohnella sp. OV330 TaxID=1855288 RepID=UPI0008EBA2D9|nr:metal ABC transporter substrate-binding protein [Cohnella sp. OV330]SFB35517.1 zinc transport system substrate-binding protein [Cohnella sp. OV330]